MLFNVVQDDIGYRDYVLSLMYSQSGFLDEDVEFWNRYKIMPTTGIIDYVVRLCKNDNSVNYYIKGFRTTGGYTLWKNINFIFQHNKYLNYYS